MSRGGRGDGAGGRGRGRGGGGRQAPGSIAAAWERESAPDIKPTELFPKYNPSPAKPITKDLQTQVDFHLLLRREIHDGPLHTQSRTGLEGPDPAKVSRAYGQEQINRRYGAGRGGGRGRGRSDVDPFTAVPTYAQRFEIPPRSLPDFSAVPTCPELFPPELRATFLGEDVSAAELRRRKGSNRAAAAAAAAERKRKSVFLDGEEYDEVDMVQAGDGSSISKKRLEMMVDNIVVEDEGAGGEDDEGEYDQEGGAEGEDEDEVFDDEDAGDYDAELYFDGGDGDDYGDDGGGEDAF